MPRLETEDPDTLDPRAAAQTGQARRSGNGAKGPAPADLKDLAAGAPDRRASGSATRPRRRRSTSSAGSTSAPPPPASSPGCSTARCRRGPTGSTRSARRPSSPSSSRRSPASSWRCSTRRRRPRPTPRSPTSTTTSSSAQLVHGMHKWGSSVMVILIFLHMGRTFFFGAYKYPRELNWVIGVVLLILTMTMAFTGYLLPFDQRSFWASIVGININGTGPVVGPYLSDFLRAGPELGATTLSRFYAIHMLLVPGRDHRPDRRPPVPGRQARHHGAAVGASREAEGRRAGRRSSTPAPTATAASTERRRTPHEAARQAGLPRGVRAPEEEGQAVLPLRGAEGLGDGADRRRRDHRDVDHPRRRAGPEGGPDHDHLRAAPRVVLLLPLRAPARDQAAGAGPDRDDRDPDRSAWSCCCCCRSTTAARSAARSAGRSRPPPAASRSSRWPTSPTSAPPAARRPRST